MSEDVAVPRTLLQLLFDIAVGSMDFGSGFLGDEEVTALRQTAELLGVDPLEGTPYEYRKRMAHAFASYERNNSYCRWCSQQADAEVHS